MNNKTWNESLDEMLAKLNNGEFVNQSINDFEKAINDSVYGTKYKTNSYKGYSTTNYRTVQPYVNKAIDNTKYDSRYQQIKQCLSNIEFENYPDEKRAGYQQALDYYLAETDKYNDNLKLLEAEIKNDINTYRSKVRSSNVDSFLLGYYDGLQMVKKIINNSKNARFAELNNKIGK
ncbi:MAG: hypothetical protein ACI4WG_00270 [Erysipelotrichaceae bacterium]